MRAGIGDLGFGLGEDDVQRIVDEGRAERWRRGVSIASAVGRAILAGSLTVCADLTSGSTKGRWSISWSEPIPHLISGARPPKVTSGHAVCLRGGDRAHPVGDAAARGQRADPRLARRLGPADRRERGRLLVAGVHDVDSLLLAAVVDGEEVTAGEGEELGRPPALHRLGNEPPAVDRAALLGG